MKDILYSYMAGFIDGEGTISIKTESTTRPYTGYLSVSNTNYEAIKLFEQEFGGKVRKRTWSNNQKNASKNWKPCYEWQISKRQAESAVKLLLPYLRIKKKQAIILLRLNKIRDKYNAAYFRWHQDKKNKCYKIFEKMKNICKRLNKRGKDEYNSNREGGEGS